MGTALPAGTRAGPPRARGAAGEGAAEPSARGWPGREAAGGRAGTCGWPLLLPKLQRTALYCRGCCCLMHPGRTASGPWSPESWAQGQRPCVSRDVRGPRVGALVSGPRRLHAPWGTTGRWARALAGGWLSGLGLYRCCAPSPAGGWGPAASPGPWACAQAPDSQFGAGTKTLRCPRSFS